VENTSKDQNFPLVSSEGGRFDKRQSCKEKLEMESAVSAVILMRPFNTCF
jgi:hypothetical protein